jgi:hypothetical protein
MRNHEHTLVRSGRICKIQSVITPRASALLMMKVIMRSSFHENFDLVISHQQSQSATEIVSSRHITPS